MFIPSDIVNIILEYYAELRGLKWCPMVNAKTGKLSWKVNKYSSNYSNICRTLEFKTNNQIKEVSINCVITETGTRQNGYIFSNELTIDRFTVNGSIKKIMEEELYHSPVIIKRIWYIEFVNGYNQYKVSLSDYPSRWSDYFMGEVYKNGKKYGIIVETSASGILGNVIDLYIDKCRH